MNPSVKIRCVGTGDAFGSGGRLNSCFLLEAAGEQLLLDCGCSSLIGLQQCGIDPAGIDTVVVSHLHGDHFGGIAFLLLEAKYVSQRQRPLTLLGPAGLQHQVEATLEALYPGTLAAGLQFPISYQRLDPEQTHVAAGYRVGCCPVKHGSSRDVYGLRVEVASKTISYTGDTEWSDSLIGLAAGSDLLIAECFAYAQKTPSHLDYQTLLQRRAELDCKRLVLTHLGAEMLQNRNSLQFEVVNDGDLIEL